MTDSVELDEAALVLLSVGRRFPGAQAMLAPVHATVQKVAVEGAQLQAQKEQCGHFNLQARFDELWAEFGTSASPAECAATGHIMLPRAAVIMLGGKRSALWVKSEAENMISAATEMFNSWRSSAGHWEILSAPHTWLGAEMMQSASGVWYGTITVVDVSNG